MAAAYAEQEIEKRGMKDVEVVMGGTEPAESVHDVVEEVMEEDGVDLCGSKPRRITEEDISNANIVVTMGCSAGEVCPATWTGDSRDWGLDDPSNTSFEEAKRIRDEVRNRVAELFDELDQDGGG